MVDIISYFCIYSFIVRMGTQLYKFKRLAYQVKWEEKNNAFIRCVYQKPNKFFIKAIIKYDLEFD